ncbi:ThuA domain-containing protein [Halopseudomonas bauzanensis]|uniref:ThuA domain-containing protein n=1 Tax=Halopseudomonas bauzanensis TaxID=653930 RepID=A0A4U0YPP6_9GAMM|nr:ThuA domain-containing protein [Halopseudomonas bauzanensis]
MAGGRLNCLLVAGGKWHDIDFARLELLKLLAEDQRIRVRVLEDYSNLDALQESDFLVSYTCDVTPALAEQEALRSYVQGGRRWLALHGTNSILRFMDDDSIDTPNWAPLFMDTLGSIFQAHPPIVPFRVEPTGVLHPLVDDIEAFEVEDEQYLVDVTAPIDVLLDTEFEGQAGRFRANPWSRFRHPVLYLRHLGEGSVCYLTLGHCRGHYDLQPLMDFYPKVERGAWELPVFHELLRRGIRWAMKEL